MNIAVELLKENIGNCKVYLKVGKVWARECSTNTLVITYVDGKIETYNIAKRGDYIVKNITPGTCG